MRIRGDRGVARRGDPDEGTLALSCEGLTKHFGGVVAVADVSLGIPRQGLFGLCGPNGAGKSTLFNLLAGSVHPEQGGVWIDGVPASGRSAAERTRLGLARTWQTVRLMKDRTVADNVAVACVRPHGRPLWRAVARTDYARVRTRAREVLEALDLLAYEGQLAGELTLEGQRMVEVARAVAGDPVVILADEPASGLSGAQRQVLAGLLGEVATTRPVLVVEHDLDLLEQVSERIYAMVNGRLVFEGTRGEFAASEVNRTLRGLGLGEGGEGDGAGASTSDLQGDRAT